MSTDPKQPNVVSKITPRVGHETGDLKITVGGDGVGMPMMQMNRVTSLRIDLNGLEITIGSSGVPSAQMQMNSVSSVTLDVDGLEMKVGDQPEPQ